jgi:hypothetical protein
MMVRAQHLFGAEADDSSPHAHHRRHAQPNDTDGTFSDEPATMQAASAAARAIAGRSLTEREKRVGGPVVHYGFGAAVGAIYAIAAELRPDTAAAAGLPFGAAVWLAADEIGVPALAPRRGARVAPRVRRDGGGGAAADAGSRVRRQRPALTARIHAARVTSSAGGVLYNPATR